MKTSKKKVEKWTQLEVTFKALSPQTFCAFRAFILVKIAVCHFIQP